MGPLFVLGSGAAFGAMGIFGKLAYDQGATVGTLLSVRFALAAALLWALEAARRERGERTPRRSRYRLPRSRSARSATRSRPGFSSRRWSGSTRRSAALLIYTSPAIVAVAAVVLGRERLDARRVAALVLASGGVVLVIGEAGALDPLGAALALGAAVVYSAYILVSDGVARRLAAADARRRSSARGAALTLGAGAALARRLPSGRADRRRLGLDRVPRRGLHGRRDRALLRRAAARRPDERLDPVHGRAARHRGPGLPRLRRDARRAPARRWHPGSGGGDSKG